MLLGLPPAGVLLAGRPIGPYFAFPPRTDFVSHAPFSWPVFCVYALVGTGALAFILFLWARSRNAPAPAPATKRPFPWWGWAGIGWGTAVWLFAWTRFSWFAPFQPHTFFPLWLGYILTMNALIHRRLGQCPLSSRPGRFVLLFPLSAIFWWFFEYLNRFVQNWHYLGSEYDAWRYALYATISFSTVLPAVLSTQRWLLTLPWIRRAFEGLLPIRPRHPARLAAWTLLLSAAVLAGIGVWPDLLFAGLWVAPLLIMVALQSLTGGRHPLEGIPKGNWRGVVSWSLAALLCGFFWEMWNAGSLSRWEYTVPFVQGSKIFAMPVLGYTGYLPFGLTCAAVAEIWMEPDTSAQGR